MKWPQHKNPTEANRTAHAPYNFVPLPQKVVTAGTLRPRDTYYADRCTGAIDCTLTTESPLYIRSGVTAAEYDAGVVSKDSPEFFYTDVHTKRPVIPGSSLRGMLRGLVEIVGYGKAQPVTQKKIFYRGVADKMTTLRVSYHSQVQAARAGYVQGRNGEYSIKPAKTIGDRSFFKVTENILRDGGISFVSLRDPRYRPQYVECWFKPSGRFADSAGQVSARHASGFEKGTLVCSGPFGAKKKKHWIVPAPDAGATPIAIPDDIASEYFDTLSDHQKQQPFDEQTGCLVQGRPVFYLERDGNVVDFGPTRNFRIGYRQSGGRLATSPRDFVPPELRHPGDVDLAEAIFGCVAQDLEMDAPKPLALVGRVSVSNAHLADNQAEQSLWLAGNPEGIIVPQILSGPKPTTFAHYLIQKKPDRVEIMGKGGARPGLDLSHYASASPGDTVTRGHKLYWHRDNVGRAQIEETAEVAPDDTQHTRFKPLRAGVEFSFRVHFENLSLVELGALLWTLKLPGPGDYRHKLGMGKPLGMGAVRIEIAELRPSKRQVRYETLFKGEDWDLGEDDDPKSVSDLEISALDAFEDAILGDEALNPGREAKSLAEIPRIRTLLALLSWPGPDPGTTGYMPLEEFRHRKVLPTPLEIIGHTTPAGAAQPPSAAPVPTPAGLERGKEVEAVVTGDWEKARVPVDLPDGLKGKLKVSRKDAPKKGERLKVVVDRRQGDFYIVELP